MKLGGPQAFVLGIVVALTTSAVWPSPSAASVEGRDIEPRVRALELRVHAVTVAPTDLLDRIARLERAFRAEAIAEQRTTPRGNPVEGGVVTSGASRARFHPILRRLLAHTGVDIGAPEGSPIRATADGVVRSRFDNPSYGLGVDLDHGRGTFTRYAHMQRTAVRSGQPVVRGTVIGFVGSTGRATGPHVHYEVFMRWHRVDPAPFLPAEMDVALRPGGAGDF